MTDVATPIEKAPKREATLVKGLQILEALTVSATPLSIANLSSSLGMGRSNVHRLLATLGHLGLVRQEDETKRYYATLKTWELGTQVVERNLVRRGARTVMQELVSLTGESAFLSVLTGTDVLYLEKLEGKNGAHSASRPGMRVPALFPASGKLLLAFQPNWEALARHAIEDVTEPLRTSTDQLMEELRQIRERGYATSQDGWHRGINSIAVPVGSGERPPIAALGFAVFPSRWEPKRLERLLELLRDAASRVSAQLEHESPTAD